MPITLMTTQITKPYFDNQNSSRSPVELPEDKNILKLKYQTPLSDSIISNKEKFSFGSSALIVGDNLLVENSVYNKNTGILITQDFKKIIQNKIFFTFGEKTSSIYTYDNIIASDSTGSVYIFYGKYIAKMSLDWTDCEWIINTLSTVMKGKIIKIKNDKIYVAFSDESSSKIKVLDTSGQEIYSSNLEFENNLLFIENDVLSETKSYSVYEPNHSLLVQNAWRFKDVQYATKFKSTNWIINNNEMYFISSSALYRINLSSGVPSEQTQKIYDLGLFNEVSAPLTEDESFLIFACYKPEEKTYSDIFKYYSGFYKTNENAIKLVKIDKSSLTVTETIMDRTPRQIVPIGNNKFVILCSGDKERINNGFLTFRHYNGVSTTYPSPGQPIINLKTDILFLNNNEFETIRQIEKIIVEISSGISATYIEPVCQLIWDGNYIMFPEYSTFNITYQNITLANSRILKFKYNSINESFEEPTIFSMTSASGINLQFSDSINPSKHFVLSQENNDITLFLNSYDPYVKAYSVTENLSPIESYSSDPDLNPHSSDPDLNPHSSDPDLNPHSSDPDLNPQKIYGVIANQGNYNLLHFSYEVKPSTEITNIDIPDLQDGIDYSKIASPTINKFSPNSSTSNTFVPYTEDSLYPINSELYVDMIISNADNVKSLSAFTKTQTQVEITDQQTYFTPKFTWSINSNIIKDSKYISSVWISSLDKKFVKVSLNQKTATPSYTLTMPDACLFAKFGEKSPNCYITSNNYLYAEQINHFIKNQEYVVSQFELNKKYNANQDVIVYQDDVAAWSVQTYKGIIVKRNSETLDIEATLEGFDSPFKMLWSKYHNSYFVAGTFNLWKIAQDLSESKPVFSTEKHRIIDFSISENGKIAIILRDSQNDYIRIINNDLYKTVNFSKYTLSSLKFCEYCGNERFYFIKENSIDNKKYIGEAILFDEEIKSHNIELNVQPQETIVDKTATTLNPILMLYPNGGETFIKGETLDIIWKSSKSINDRVKIELYNLTDPEIITLIAASVPNTGSYRWTIPATLPLSSNYSIKATWISTSDLAINADMSNATFILAEEKPEAKLEITTVAGISYDSFADQLIIVLNNGMIAMHDLKTLNIYGLFNTKIKDVTSVQAINERTYDFDTVSKIRIFVGTESGLNNKWDSGILETNLTSVYYGGGNNLAPGETYYVNIQVYSPQYGWSPVQSQQFTMPN